MRKKLIRAFSSLAMALVLGINLSSYAVAYNLMGCRHEVPKVYYHFDNWLDSNVRTAMSAACEAWKSKTTKITMQRGIAQSGSIDVYVSAGDLLDESTEAVTYTRANKNSKYVTYQDIAFNNQVRAWNDPNALQSVAAHEIGHVFGLDEMDWKTKTLMNQYTYGTGGRYEGYNITTPQADDIDGINEIYK